MSDKEELTRLFENRWRIIGGPGLEREYRFAPPRRFRFDFASEAAHIAIELEGGVFTGGRHTRPTGYTDDCIKYNLAQLHGWRVFRFTRPMLENDPAGHLCPVRDLINLLD